MADWMIIEGIPPYDGRYEIEVAAITSRELGWIKRLASTLPAQIDEGMQGGDAELFCVLAAIALRRAGKIDARDIPDVFERLVDGPYGSTIQTESDEAEDDAELPPPARPAVNGATSGADSRPSSESPEDSQSPTGTPGSAASESGLPTSVT